MLLAVGGLCGGALVNGALFLALWHNAEEQTFAHTLQASLVLSDLLVRHLAIAVMRMRFGVQFHASLKCSSACGASSRE